MITLSYHQVNLPLPGAYQGWVAGDTAIQFAPFNVRMLIHKKAINGRETICGLALPTVYGDWAAMGAFSKHWAVNPNSICDECASNPLPNQTTQYEQSEQTK